MNQRFFRRRVSATVDRVLDCEIILEMKAKIAVSLPMTFYLATVYE
jgi:hypothetical protein